MQQQRDHGKHRNRGYLTVCLEFLRKILPVNLASFREFFVSQRQTGNATTEPAVGNVPLQPKLVKESVNAQFRTFTESSCLIL
jgi:hypothetical protein